MDLCETFSSLEIEYDDDNRPTYRSAPGEAFAQWQAVPDTEGCSKLRCTGDLDDFSWDAAGDFNEIQSLMQAQNPTILPPTPAPTMLPPTPAPSIIVSLIPHREESTECSGAIERLVCSLRPFTVTATLVDGTGQAIFDHDADICLVASLVFADTGHPVPATGGEAPCSGETVAKHPRGGVCTFRLRTSALSYRHGRRAFAVRIDMVPTPDSTVFVPFVPCSACSPPLYSRARLPDQPKPVVQACVQGAPPCVSMSLSTGSSAIQVSSTASQPTPQHLAPGHQEEQPSLQHQTSYPGRRPPAVPTVDEQGDRDDATMEEEEDQLAMCSETAAPCTSAPSALVSILHEQSEQLQAALEEQRHILSEFSKLTGVAAPMQHSLMQVA